MSDRRESAEARPTEDLSTDGGNETTDGLGDPGQRAFGDEQWRVRESWGSHGSLGFVIAFLIPAVALPLLYINQGLHFDEGIFLTVGKQVAAGERLYTDIADHKPPGVFLLATMAYELSGAPVYAVRAMTYVVTAISGLLVIRLGQQFLSRSAARAAGILFVVMSYLPHFDGTVFMSEPFAVVTMLTAAVLLGRDTTRATVLAGVALAIGVFFNQTVFLFGGTIILFHLLRLRYPANRTRAYLRTSTIRILTIGVGYLAATGIGLGLLYTQGLLAETIYYSVTVPLSGYSTPFDLWGHLLALMSLLPVWLLVAGVLVLTGNDVIRGRAVDDRFLFVALWALVLSVPGATAFYGDHKFVFAFPALALLAVAGLTRLAWRASRDLPQFRTLSSQLPSRTALFTGLLVAVLVSTTVVAAAGNTYYASARLEGGLNDDEAAVTAAVEGIEGPVYGFNVRSELYVFSDVEPATTFVGTIYTDAIAREKIEDLERNNVQYVVVGTGSVSDGKVASSGYWAEHKSIMASYINEHYEPTRETDDYVVFERTS